jgi:hypothetical protein
MLITSTELSFPLFVMLFLFLDMEHHNLWNNIKSRRHHLHHQFVQRKNDISSHSSAWFAIHYSFILIFTRDILSVVLIVCPLLNCVWWWTIFSIKSDVDCRKNVKIFSNFWKWKALMGKCYKRNCVFLRLTICFKRKWTWIVYAEDYYKRYEGNSLATVLIRQEMTEWKYIFKSASVIEINLIR